MSVLLYNIINKEKLHKILDTFYNCIHLPLQLLDENGEIIEHFGNENEYCSLFRKCISDEKSCIRMHSAAGRMAMNISESYIFSCHGGLNHIIFPLSRNKMLLGSILLGPFLMQEPDSLLIADIGKKYSIPALNQLELYEEATHLPVYEPSQVTHISHLLYYTCVGLLIDTENEFLINNQKYYQQSEINEYIQNYKLSSDNSKSSYPYEKEKDLINKLKTGDTVQAKALINDLLGYVFFSEGQKIEIVKSRALEICSLLSRAAIEGGATSDSILKINNRFLQSIQSITDIYDLCYKLQESIDVFTESIFNYIPTKNNELIKSAVRFISKNYSSNLTLEETAAHVHLNPAYFSTLFKQLTGSSYIEYINMVRIEHSKYLLASSNMSIIEISAAVGFTDQSYFSKVFKKYTGFTPKQYR